MEEEEEADYYILTSHFPTAPGLNSKMCEGMHGGEKRGDTKSIQHNMLMAKNGKKHRKNCECCPLSQLIVR